MRRNESNIFYKRPYKSDTYLLRPVSRMLIIAINRRRTICIVTVLMMGRIEALHLKKIGFQFGGKHNEKLTRSEDRERVQEINMDGERKTAKRYWSRE